jgi:hypothetical protein
MRKDDAPGSTAPDAAVNAKDGEQLWRSEERFRLLVEGVTDYAIGKHFTIFYPPEALARDLPKHALEVARREGHFGGCRWPGRCGRAPRTADP